MEKDKRTEVQSLSTFPLLWIDSRALFWILILMVRHCESRGVLTIRLLHYQNDYGQTFDGDCCDHRSPLSGFQPQNCGVQCDYVLRLLITGLGRANEHVFRFRRPIKYNANNIKFEDSTAELTIPFSSWPGEAGLLVFFYDYDDTDDSARLVDWFQTRLIHPGNVAYQELYGNRKLHKTRLQFDWSVRSEGSLKKADSSNHFTTLTSRTSEYRPAWKIQNNKYERVKEDTPAISNTSNSSSPPSSIEKIPVHHTAKVTKRLSQNKTDSYFTASANLALQSQQTNESKRLESQILSPSKPADFIKNIPVVRQKQTGLYNNKTASRLYQGTSPQTPFFNGRLNNQSTPTTLSTSSQSVNSSRVHSLRRTLPSSDTVRNDGSLKGLKDVKRSRSGVAEVAEVTEIADKKDSEFAEGDSFTFEQAIVVTKWQESLDNVKRHVIKTAAAAASLRVRKKAKKDSSLSVNKGRGSSRSEKTVNDLRVNNESDIKPSEVNQKITKNPRLKERIVKDVQLSENTGNKSNPNKQIKEQHMKLKYKSSDNRTRVTEGDIPDGKQGIGANSKNIQITESEFQLQVNGTRFDGNYNDSGIKPIGFTNKQYVINKIIPTPLPMDSTLNHGDNLLDLSSEDAVTVDRAKAAEDEPEFGNMADSMTKKNEQKDNENPQKRSTTNRGFKTSTEQTSFGSGDFDKAFEDFSNTITQFPYSRVVPIITTETPFVEITSSAHGEEGSTDSTFKKRLLPDQTPSYHLHPNVPSLTSDQQTTTKFTYISSRFPLNNFVNRLSFLENSGSDIDTELSSRTASHSNVLSPPFIEILNKNRESILTTEQRGKEKHFSSSGQNLVQASTDRLLNPTTSIRHSVSFLYSADKLQSGISTDTSSTTSTKQKDQNWHSTKHPELGSNILKATDSSVTNKKTINSVASTKNNKKTFGKNENLQNQKTMEEPENANNSNVLNENGLRNNNDGIKELRHTKFLEIDSSKKQYSQRQNQVAENKKTDVSNFTDRKKVSKDQSGDGRESNNQNKVWQKNSGKAGINKNDSLYQRGYLTAVSLLEVNSDQPVGVLRDETNDSSKDKKEDKEWFSLEQIARPMENQKDDPKRIERILDAESVVRKIKTGFISPESMLTSVKESNIEISSGLSDRDSQDDIIEKESLKTTRSVLTDNMASILFSLPNFKDNITTKKYPQQNNTFYNKEIGTTEEIARNENYPTKENSDESKHSKSFLQNQKQTVLSPNQFDKNILKERNHGSKNGKTWTAALKERIQSTSTIKSYNENESLTNSTTKSTKSVDTKLNNNKETTKYKNNNWPVTNSSLTKKSHIEGLEFTEKRSQNPRHETAFTPSDAVQKTVNISPNRTSIKGLKSRSYIPTHNVSTSNPSSAEKKTERIITELPQLKNKSKNARHEDKIKMEDITVKERKHPSTHTSTKATMADSKNPTKDPELPSVSLRYTRGNLLSLELKENVSEKSLEYSPVTDSRNKDFNYNNKNIQTKENTLVRKIIDGRYNKTNEKDLVKEVSIHKGVEDKFNTGSSLESGSNVHSIFPVFSTTPGFYSTLVAESMNVLTTKEEDSTAPAPSPIEPFELETVSQNHNLSSNSPQTTSRYKKLSENELVLTTDKRVRFSDNSDSDDHSQIVKTIDNSKTIKEKMFDYLFNKGTSDVTKITQNTGFPKTLKNVHFQPTSKTTSTWNQITADLPFSQEKQNSTKINIKTSESIKTKVFPPLLNRNKVTPDKQRKSGNNSIPITPALLVSSTRSLKLKILTTTTTTRGYMKRTLPKWIIFPQNFEDFLRHSHQKPYKEPSQQTTPVTKISPSYKQNELRPKAAAKDRPLSGRATTTEHFVPRWSTVYLKEKKLYQPSAKSLSQNQPKRTDQEQTSSKNTTDKIGLVTISDKRNISNTNLLQDNSMEENWRFQPILEIQDVFEKYWPAILGSTFGALFLGAAILTSLMCKRRTRVRRRRVKRSSRDQRYSPQPPVSEYSSGSSLFEENSPVSETPTSIDEIS